MTVDQRLAGYPARVHGQLNHPTQPMEQVLPTQPMHSRYAQCMTTNNGNNCSELKHPPIKVPTSYQSTCLAFQSLLVVPMSATDLLPG
jgi:hypothetical protein